MILSSVIGSAAAFLTTVSFIPQVIKSCRAHAMEGVSLAMYLIFATGVTLWLIYGVMLSSYPIITCNSTTLLLVLIILVRKISDMMRKK